MLTGAMDSCQSTLRRSCEKVEWAGVGSSKFLGALRCSVVCAGGAKAASPANLYTQPSGQSSAMGKASDEMFAVPGSTRWAGAETAKPPPGPTPGGGFIYAGKLFYVLDEPHEYCCGLSAGGGGSRGDRAVLVAFNKAGAHRPGHGVLGPAAHARRVGCGDRAGTAGSPARR